MINSHFHFLNTVTMTRTVNIRLIIHMHRKENFDENLSYPINLIPFAEANLSNLSSIKHEVTYVRKSEKNPVKKSVYRIIA